MAKHLVRQPFQDYDLTAAERYDLWYDGAKGRAVALAEEGVLAGPLAGLSRAKTVLDVGCGTGHFSRWFANRGLSVVGLDLSPGMLAVANGRGGGPRYLRGSARRLPFPDQSIDVVAFITELGVHARSWLCPGGGHACGPAGRAPRRSQRQQPAGDVAARPVEIQGHALPRGALLRSLGASAPVEGQRGDPSHTSALADGAVAWRRAEMGQNAPLWCLHRDGRLSAMIGA